MPIYHGITLGLGLDVWSTNERALTFYRHLGYRPESLCLVKPLDEPAGSTSAAGELAVRPLRTDERAGSTNN